MTLQRRPPAVQRDPAVDATLSDAARRVQRRAMSPAQRKKADQDAQRIRLNIDLTHEVMKAIRAEAAELGVSMANLLTYRVVTSINQSRRADEDLRAQLTPASGGSALRFPFELAIPDLIEPGQTAHSQVEDGWGTR